MGCLCAQASSVGSGNVACHGIEAGRRSPSVAYIGEARPIREAISFAGWNTVEIELNDIIRDDAFLVWGNS